MTAAPSGLKPIGARLVGGLSLIYGLLLLWWAVPLVLAAGSPGFLIIGAASVVAGVLMLLRRVSGAMLAVVIFVATMAWAAAQVGFSPYLLLPRIWPGAIVGLLALLIWARREGGASARAVAAGAPLVAASLAALLLIAHHGSGPALAEAQDGPGAAAADGDAQEWTAWGHTLSGTRYSAASQITPANVDKLEVAWTYRTGEDPMKPIHPYNRPVFEATPLKVGNTLYLCTPRSALIALDAASGKELWRVDPKTDVKEAFVLACRGVSYYEAPTPVAQCQKRILWGTMDGRMLAVDALSGKPCTDFGDKGTVALTKDIGPIKPGTFGVTSPPTIVDGVAITSSFVLDDQSVDVPSGVVRGYDAVTGRQLWAWDAGRDDPNAALKPGETYTRGSANAWGVFSADRALGLVYLGTGIASPDYFGGQRTAAGERNSSALVALDFRTGKQRWIFQAIHHDLFDYDVNAQPVLTDLDTPKGKVPVVIQPTKSGQIFVLDRRTGKPVLPIAERPVSTYAAPGDHVSPTQPVSTAMPSFAGPRWTEATLWGVSPFDLMACQTAFRKLRYDGPFTAPSPEGSLQSPSNTGGFEWGSVSVDEGRQILLANTNYFGTIVTLVPRAQVVKLEAAGKHQWTPQDGTPFGDQQRPFVSSLGFPCTPPPWGLMTAISLRTKQILWQKPLGTTRDKAPFGIALPLGMPNVGGSLVTRSGLTFIGAALESGVRAFDTRTGKTLWTMRLPASPQATPMTYEQGGRQYVVLSVGGHAHMKSQLGDYVMAFALPAGSK